MVNLTSWKSVFGIFFEGLDMMGNGGMYSGF